MLAMNLSLILERPGLAVGSIKKPRFYNKTTADPYSRLRVPKYLKSFEVLFFLVFLVLYYSVLVERNPLKISLSEVLLYVWFAAFFYDELSEWSDAGSIFYAADVSQHCICTVLDVQQHN